MAPPRWLGARGAYTQPLTCLIMLLFLPALAQGNEPPPESPGPMFSFSRPSYNVSIPENSMGKTYVTPVEKMGILTQGLSDLEIRYKIVGGDKDRFFKAEERQVGNFCFLLVRTRTGTIDVLNRERKDKFQLQIRATGRRTSSNAVLNSAESSEVEAETVVFVQVLDSNDLNPLFFPTEYEETVPEDMPLHRSILKVTAEDADIGRNGEIYYSFLESTEQFAVHPMTGVVSLTRPLRFNEKAMHELTVVARDRGAILFRGSGGAKTSTARMRIHVKQVNLNSPEILVHPLPDIVEQSHAHIYAIVRVRDRDQGIHGEIESLEIVDGDPDGHFRIKSTDKDDEFNIEVLSLLDRETAPQGYNLTLKASDRGIPQRHSYKAVPVHLADVNDNAPVFNREIYEVDVPETAPINSPVIRLKVTDADEGKNAQVFLEIVGGNEGGEFLINPETGMLYTAKMLDAEFKAFYTLTVSAIDQGNSGTRKQSSAKVKINVQDTNDNDPLFETDEVIVEMNENEPAGTSVTKVYAKDGDSGENAYISYAIVNLNPVPFEIDHFSGVVRTTTVLDYESMKRQFMLRIRASDWGQPYRRQTEMQLKIKVKDINDNRPQFEKVSCVGRVSRYVTIGTEIITLSALDFDAGNIISYRIVSGNEDGCFALDSTSGVLTVTCDLGDVRSEERQVNVTATDGTNFADVTFVRMQLVNTKPPSNTPAHLLSDAAAAFDCRDTGVARRLTEVIASAERNNIQGKEDLFAMMPSRYGENVHSPEYIDFPTEIQVNESVPLNTVLKKLRARDRDRGYNGKIVFGISTGDVDSVFRLDPDTGELKVVGYLDRERESEYYLNVTVYDLGKPQKSTSRVLPVSVLDVNDNAPKFDKAVASFRVTENAHNGTAIFRANASDADAGENAKVTYALVTDTQDFNVDPTTGVLTVNARLDREKQALYELKIRASDSAKERPLSSYAVVRISIDDVNDNAPTFALPSYTVKVREDIPSGSVVAVLSATDPDLGQGGEVRYSLAPGGDSAAFTIDRASGTVRTTAILDFEERQIHTLTIRAKDRGTPPLSSETQLIVEVVDVNENRFPPKFDDFVMSAKVRENLPPGSHVTFVKASDADPPGDDSRVSYSIRGGDGVGLFTIDDQGNITTLAVLDRESKNHYWLTVFAQDHGVVPLHSRLEVYIEVENENDNVPLTLQPVYYPTVAENSGPGREVITLLAEDADREPGNLNYKITAGNPESFFSIENGTIRTTGRKLDRENQAEHILEVTVSDQGTPPLSSTTRVVVIVEDVNDHAPEFPHKFLKANIPALPGDVEYPVFQVLAHDADSGPNGELEYSIKSGRGKGKFKIHPKTGEIFAQRGLQAGQEYDLMVRAMDHGQPQRSHTTRVSLHAVPVPETSLHPPVVKSSALQVTVTESDEAGFLVSVLQAEDPDGDLLWYHIVDGDDRGEFYIGHSEGNILLAKQLDWETQNLYSLNISVTDGVHTVYTQLNVTVLDINDHRPEFSAPVYPMPISENVEPGTSILQLSASDKDEDKKVFFSLHAARNPASLDIFKIDSITGAVTLNEKVDRETTDEHVLTVMVKDQGTPSKRNYARVIITVHDHNDHAPTFSEDIVQGRVYETASVGSQVAQVYAIDRDRGDNAKITYAITSGNVGNAFSIDPELGTVQVAKELDLSSAREYVLRVKATDSGSPSQSSTVRVHIMLTMADNAPPKFVKAEHAAEIYENLAAGTFVLHIEARSTSSLFYEILGGNHGDVFFVNPSTGVVITKRPLDYERAKFYNLTVEATNMAGAKAQCHVIVHVLDQNDNAPEFLQDFFVGSVSESAAIGSLVLTNESAPLVIKAQDRDSELNALLHYDIVESLPRKFFRIDSSTGAIRTVMSLDHEQQPEFKFHVKVSDLGKPRLSSETMAEVKIIVTDVNDCPPVFLESEYNATLLLPTYQNVAVTTVSAVDPDSPEKTSLKFDIIEGNDGNVFAVHAKTGIVTVLDSKNMKSFYRLHLRVSDGTFSTVTHVNIKVERSENSGLSFHKDVYYGTILENSTKITTVVVVNVLGSALNEHLVFSILNPTDMFTIGHTSGAVRTTGIRFDREEKDSYELIVEARSDEDHGEHPRVAHVMVNVTILDINDNCPMFVNLPYYAVVSVDALKGDTVTKVHAVDMDKGENGEVRYELIKGHGELFKVCRRTGEITLKQNLEGHNREYELVIGAYDGGITPCASEVPVHIKVIDRSMPVFDKQFYTDSVPEDIEIHSPLSLSIQAESPLGRKLIYSIVKGNDYEEFALDFNTAPDSKNGPCVLYVVDELDYELKKQYELTIRATDSVSGVFAEVIASIRIEDVNDCPPEFSQDAYNVSVSEAAPFGTSILKVQSKDNDTGNNQKVKYKILVDNNNSSDYFHIDADDGSIYLKRALDHEVADSHHFIVVATDLGVPRLSTTAHVWVSVVDMNDNPPKFEQPSYTCFLSEHAQRLQFVTIVTASDPDSIDQERLTYTIVGGNEQQTFHIDPTSGIISLINLQNFAILPIYLLNVSVTDGVYTSFARVKIDILSANNASPNFSKVAYEALVRENQLAGVKVTQVTAQDTDRGKYGEITYSIPSQKLQEIFDINSKTGDVVTKRALDREDVKIYEIPVMAADGGGRSGFSQIRVKVTDENDNPPKFLLRESKSTIHSNFTVGSGIVRVRALDADEEIAAEIEYSIYENEPSEISELFAINKNTGEITLVKSAIGKENQVFQFFVRAQDRGSPPLHADLPVEVFFMGPDDVAPMFERRDDKFFITENSAPGLVISRLKMVTTSPVKFRIVSVDGTEEDSPLFGIDSTGQLTLSGKLDREVRDTYIVSVLAETESSPSLTALTDVTLKILDENDNAPEFESSPYKLQLAENTHEGTSILKVTAHDLDQGKNKEVRYSFGSDIGDLANIFTIDAFTGWVTTLVPLDMEKKSEFEFQVVATDNGNPKHFARTQVYVKLIDYNDNPPAFSNAHYIAAVNEDALPGTVVLQLSTSDPDSDVSPVQFYITGGDPLSQFQIRSTGEVFVVKELDRESVPRYVLEVTATDGKYIATTKVTIDILDANDNPPYCLRYRYRHILSEGTQPGSYILSVLASDIDEEPNANLRFYLTGEGADKFFLDKAGGHLKTARPLDREEQARFSLTAHVQDQERPGWECSSQLELLVSDLNDNAPRFSLETYTSTLPENTEVGTLVTKVHATDRDIGINRKIKYSLLESANGHFKMASDSGIVTLSKPLDREQRAMFNLTVMASDQGTPQLSSTASVVVMVLDINDNPPEFATRLHHARVAEISPVGTELVRVTATSRDSGVNAEITYSIIGGNEHNKFEIHPKTGVIIVSEPLDYERAKDYFLTIQAVDGGDPPLSNHATVNITVSDNNDNAPMFSQVSFSARIREDAVIGDKILQVIANDLDSGINGEMSYFIEKGDRHKQFKINEKTGYISVAGHLDREMVSSYVLEVMAKDHGTPQLSSSVMVNVDISDANDNPPIFSQANYTAIVQEDKPLGFTILKFVVSDADGSPNAAPYTFDFRSGNEGSVFILEQDGILRTAARFNHKIKDNYLLHVRVFDNGSPPLFSDTWVVVKVIEESQYPPAITPQEISVNSYNDDFPGGVLGRIRASDQDPYDHITFGLAPSISVPSPRELFELETNEGVLTSRPGLDVGQYLVNVTATDGKFTSFTLVKVNVELVTDEMVKHGVIVKFRDVTPEDFIFSYKKNFVKAIKSALNVRLKDVLILSIQPSAQSRRIRRSLRVNHNLDVLFVVRAPTGGLLASSVVSKGVSNKVEELEVATGLAVQEVVLKRCTPIFCKFGECIDLVTLDRTHMVSVTTELTSFVSPQHHYAVKCHCKDGYDGERCDRIVNECAREPCPPFKLCVPDASTLGYSCQCPEGFAGASCNIDMSKCHDEACYIPRNPVSFSGKSYAQYRVDKALVKKALQDRLNLSLRVRTMQPTGTLMYAAGKVDYNVLEVVNGVVQYRFDLGSGEGLVRVSSVFVSDSQWHEVTLTRDSNSAKLTVDGKHVAHGSAPGINDVLNLQTDDLYFGAEVRQHPTILGFEDVQRGYIGCMDDIKIDHVALPLHMSGASSVATLKRFANVEFHCEQVLLPAGVCGSQPCHNGGTCKDLMSISSKDQVLVKDPKTPYKCLCHARFTGKSCEVDLDPCASGPCLHGGRCIVTDNDFACDCPPRLSGKRCEYGRYCNPNPCRNGGVCEEGDQGPMCKCRGFTGDLCMVDINECETSPCHNGGTCVNEPGGYKCVCPSNTSGPLCSKSLQNSSFSSLKRFEEYLLIGAVLLGVLLLLCCVFICRRCHVKRKRKRAAIINNETMRKDIMLNSTRGDIDFKRSSKLSNLEVGHQVPPQCPPRPASYTPSTHDSAAVAYSAALNNLDTLRSYGSAGDELEHVPPDYVRNLNPRVAPSHPAGDADGVHKGWADTDLHTTYIDHSKIKNDLRRGPVLLPDVPVRNSILKPPPGASATSLSSMEDDPRMLGGYHWDCSDWNQTQTPLPNITEVPGSEVPDSSSFHSNESNESNTHHGLSHATNKFPLTECRREADGEENGYVVDSEGCTDFDELTPSSCLQKLLASPILENTDNEEYPYRKDGYRSHPNQYLPKPSYSETETDDAMVPLKRFNRAISEDTDDDIVPYGFPNSHAGPIRLDPDGSIITGLDEQMSLSMGGYTSASDLSNVCDIDDSEYESEKLNKYTWPDVTHTSV